MILRLLLNVGLVFLLVDATTEVFFDKTGTLTRDQLDFVRWMP